MSNANDRDISTEIVRVNWRIRDFCDAHAIGRTLFYDEVNRGEIRVIKIGRRTVVSDNEAKAWQARKARASK